MSKLQKRIIYFGTNGCVGHYPLGINFTLSKEEYNDFEEIDRIMTDEILDENTGTFLRYLPKGVAYVCFGVPYSPDDECPGSKTKECNLAKPFPLGQIQESEREV